MALAGCGQRGKDTIRRVEDDRTLTAAEYTLLNLAGTDALGREITPKSEKKSGERYVGIFYSLWLGQHQYMQSAIFDINKLLSTEEGAAALASLEDNAMSRMGEFHFCGEPVGLDAAHGNADHGVHRLSSDRRDECELLS